MNNPPIAFRYNYNTEAKEKTQDEVLAMTIPPMTKTNTKSMITQQNL
jgi:hypothetical protein